MLVCTMCFTSISFTLSSHEVHAVEEHIHEEHANLQTYYHLDMGVWPIPYDGNRYAFGYKYGDTQTKEFTITFGKDVEVIGAHAYLKEADVFQFGNPNCTSNVPVLDDNGKRIPGATPALENYSKIYAEQNSVAFPQNITNIKVSNTSKRDVKLAYNIKLQSAEEYDAVDTARKHLNQIEATKEVVKEIKSKQYVLTGSDRAAKEKLLAEYKKERETLIEKNSEKQYNKIVQLNTLISELEKILQEIKTVSETITTYEYEEGVLLSQFEKYQNEIYSYWGDKASLESYDSVLAQCIDNVWTQAMTNPDMKFGLVFVPIVIEYRAAGKTCTHCHKCILDPDSPDEHCTDDSCKDYNTPNCGCFENLCQKCGICELDPNGPDKICTADSCDLFGTEECGCYGKCVKCKVCTLNPGSTENYCTQGSCEHYNSPDCGCYAPTNVGDCSDKLTKDGEDVEAAKKRLSQNAEKKSGKAKAD